MSRFDLISDISLLTTLPDKTLRKLCDKGAECICHNVLESINEAENETSVDLTIGELKIIVRDDEIHYKFKPSSKLESMLVSTLTTKEDPLVKSVEDGLVSRIMNTYKDLI